MSAGEERRRVTLSGELELDVDGVDVRLTVAEYTSRGSFEEPAPPVRLELRSTMGELRKLVRVNPSIGTVLALRADVEDWEQASVTLVAQPLLVDRLRSAASGVEHGIVPGLTDRAEWLGALFALEHYDAESVATNESASS